MQRSEQCFQSCKNSSIIEILLFFKRCEIPLACLAPLRQYPNCEFMRFRLRRDGCMCRGMNPSESIEVHHQNPTAIAKPCRFKAVETGWSHCSDTHCRPICIPCQWPSSSRTLDILPLRVFVFCFPRYPNTTPDCDAPPRHSIATPHGS